MLDDRIKNSLRIVFGEGAELIIKDTNEFSFRQFDFENPSIRFDCCYATLETENKRLSSFIKDCFDNVNYKKHDGEIVINIPEIAKTLRETKKKAKQTEEKGLSNLFQSVFPNGH